MTALRTRFAPLCVLLIALLSLGIGLTELPVQDRDEARFAQASRQMAETGDYIDIRLQDAPRHNKPALIYWAQTIAIEVTGASGNTPIWVHRLPSYLAGVLSAIALIWAATPIVGRRAAVVAGLMCATVYMLHAEARTAKTDAALLLSVIVAMGALGRMWLATAKAWLTPLIFWTALAAGFLLKGPMVALPVLGAIAWVSVQFRTFSWLSRLRPVVGIIVFIALASPWFIAITIVTEGAFWGASLGGDLTDKITAEGEHAGSPPGFYLATVWATFFPWSLLLPLGAVLAWRTRSERTTAFALGWLIPGWIVFEAVPVKLIHYTLPLYPALMILCAAALVAIADGRLRFKGWPAVVGSVGFLIALGFFATVVVMAPLTYGAPSTTLSILAAVALCGAALTALLFAWRDKALGMLALLVVLGGMLGPILTAITLPSARELWVSERLAEATSALTCVSGPVALAGYAEPSAVFLLGTQTLLTDAEGALAYLAEAEDRAAWIDPALVPDAPVGLAGATQVNAVNVGNFRPVTLRLYLSPGVPAPDQPCQ